MLRRETIIALRARHQAFRIALDILYPPQKPPEVPVVTREASREPGMATLDPAWVEEKLRWVERRERRAQLRAKWISLTLPALLLAMLLTMLVAALVLAVQIRRSQPAPPPPPARPILPAQ